MKYGSFLLLSLLLSACSLLGPVPVASTAVPGTTSPSTTTPTIATPTTMPSSSADVTPPSEHTKGWWSVRFAIDWPDKAEVSWYVDVYLAHKIIKPVLTQYQQEIELWRFHRRAARDAAGHQFSFIFYSEPAVAEAIYKAVRDDKQVQLVIDKGLIDKVIYQNTAVNSQPLVKDTSDPSWSLPIQKSWPYFIMGVSDMWLRLINELVQQDIGKASFNDYDDVLSFYKEIGQRLDNTWRDEGGHAFLHHLNALFGYQETIVVERRMVHF